MVVFSWEGERAVQQEYVWVCSACGKFAMDRMGLKDASCYMHAVACRVDSLEWSEGRVHKANAYTGDTVEGPVESGRLIQEGR